MAGRPLSTPRSGEAGRATARRCGVARRVGWATGSRGRERVAAAWLGESTRCDGWATERVAVSRVGWGRRGDATAGQRRASRSTGNAGLIVASARNGRAGGGLATAREWAVGHRQGKGTPCWASRRGGDAPPRWGSRRDGVAQLRWARASHGCARNVARRDGEGSLGWATLGHRTAVDGTARATRRWASDGEAWATDCCAPQGGGTGRLRSGRNCTGDGEPRAAPALVCADEHRGGRATVGSASAPNASALDRCGVARRPGATHGIGEGRRRDPAQGRGEGWLRATSRRAGGALVGPPRRGRCVDRLWTARVVLRTGLVCGGGATRGDARRRLGEATQVNGWGRGAARRRSFVEHRRAPALVCVAGSCAGRALVSRDPLRTAALGRRRVRPSLARAEQTSAPH